MNLLVNEPPRPPGQPLCQDPWGQGWTCAFRAIASPEGRRGCADALLSMTSIQTQTSLALGRSTSYDQVLDLATAGDPTADRIVSNAARAFGVLIVAVANIALPERVLLTGEGIRLAEVGWDRLQDSIGESRNPEEPLVAGMFAGPGGVADDS